MVLVEYIGIFFLHLQSQVIKLTSCLPMVGGSLRLLPPLKLVAMIQLKVALNTKNQINQSFFISCGRSKQKTNSKYRHPRYYVIGLHKSSDVLFHKMLSSSNQCNQSIIIVLNSLLIVLPERAPSLEIKYLYCIVLLCSREINSFKIHCTNTQQCYS